MKNFIKFISLILISALLGSILCSFTNKDGKYLESESFSEELILKGLKGARALSNNEENIYIAVENKILKIDRNNNVFLELKEGGNIYDLEYYNGFLYYTLDEKLVSYNIKSSEREVLIEDIPNKGINKEDTRILINEGKIYLTIGTSTNSGIVDEERENPDIPPVDIVLSGRNYDENKKGAFVPYNTKTSKGEKIKGNILGNGAIIELDIESKKKQLYSYGIRNVKGFDLNSSGEIFAIVGGIEDEGYRPLSGDSDYIYKIEGKGTWYGWPDYSGGDPVNSPRFREEGKPIINFVTDAHKSYVMPKPLYQSESVGNINTLLIDREGTILGDENSFLFFNNKNNTLSKLLKEGEVKELIYLDKNSYINDMKIIWGNLYILDGNKGVLFRLEKSDLTDNIPIYNYFVILGINFIFIGVLVIKFILSLKKK
ncbi:PQQ-dependent sugar dehydrogenase [Clostridium perfringens]|uniref:PQQ-dependent sugar dehydrogenase n=1 Tax=Clostridium perfringens TaxID=1502 RepID=UPI0024BC7E7E|nr:PQQ-dependent sugar dehydrogenase [Clostridium perfringens]